MKKTELIVTLISALLISLLLVVSVPSLKATDEAPLLQWSKNYGPYAGFSVIQTNDGGYAIAGSAATYGTRGYYNYSALLIKTDSLGEVQWRKTYITEPGGSALTVIQTEDSGYALSGHGGWLLKLDAQGSVQWNRTFGFQWNLVSAIYSSDGGYVFAGYMANSNNGDDALLIKTNEDGDFLWNKTFSSLSAQFVMAGALVETSDMGYAVAGGWGTAFWFAKTDADGNLQLNKTYPLSDTGNGFGSIANTFDGGYILVGVDNSDGWLVKIDSQANMQWNQRFEFPAGLTTVIQAPDGGYLAAGRTVIKTDSSGTVQWSNATPGLATSMIVTKDGGYAVAGSTYSGTIWLMKFAPESSIPPDSASPGDTPPPFSTTVLVAAVIVAVIVVGVGLGLLIYLIKRK